MRLKTAIFLLGAGAVSAFAQEFTYVDWDILQLDSVPAQYSEVIPLDEDYRQFSYEVRLDYPEYVRLTAEEARRVAAWGESLPESPEVYSQVGVSRKKGMLDVSFVPVVRRGGQYYKLTSFKMNIVRRPTAALRGAAAPAAQAASERYAEHSVLSQGRWVKIGITDDGVYRLTASDLQRMGFADPSRVKLYGYGGHVQDEVIDADTDFDDLEEVPLYRDDRGLLFFGRGLLSWSAPDRNGRSTHRMNTFARQACYFLTEGDAPQTMETERATASPRTDLDYTPANVLYKKEEYSWYQSGRTFYEDVNYASANTQTYRLPSPHPVASAGGSLKVYFTAHFTDDKKRCTVQSTVDGETRNTITIYHSGEYDAAREGTATYTLSSLGDETEVTLTSTAGIDARLGYLELCYRRQLRMNDSYLYIRHSETSAANFVIDTQGRTGVKLWRLGRRGEPVVEMQGTLSGNTLTVPVDDPSREYVAVDVDADFPSPTYIGEVANQDLHALSACDMVILIPTSGRLLAQAERLAEAHRSLDGLRVQIVRADQVYNEFSSGTPDATAYRRLMKMLYDRAETEADMPRYLLLFGDGVWDNRMLTSAVRGLNPDDYLLCYESENSLSHTSSFVMEDYFGLLDDGEGDDFQRNKVDLGVGRFPVTTEADAKIMVDKTIDYMENAHAGAWRNVICVLGDDGDENDHIIKAEQLSQIVEDEHPDMQVNRIYWDAYRRESGAAGYSYPAVEADIKAQMDEGCLMMNYSGHGNPRELSHEKVLRLADFSSYSSPNLPLWVTAACDVSPFDMLEDNIGERAVLHAGGTAVAFLGTTRTVYSTANSWMNRYFTRQALGKDANGRRNALGDAVRLAKVELVTPHYCEEDKIYDYHDSTDVSVNKLHYVLLGDPALKLGVPEYELVVDSINGRAVGEGLPLADFKAGSIARVSGHVEDAAGQTLTDYSGVLSATVYDSESTITCLNNDGEADEPVTYVTRDKRLYSGRDSVRNGEFRFTFPVPMDIKYSGESGRILLYAIDNTKRREANGFSEQVTVGGSSDELSGDTEGPQIQAYLNREDFVSGGTVNATPYFVAALEDESGINVTNTAVGHDLELTIDGDPSKTYILNSEYESVLGDYRRGQLAYVIPALEDGPHTLTFRAWDVMNNSSTVTLDFHVDGGLQPDLIDLSCTNNPAREHTTFIMRYDRPGTECDFTIEVFDFAGRKLWTHTEHGTSADGIYRVDWDLTAGGGMPLSTGVYLYRAHVSTSDSKAASRTNKIIILRNK